MPAHSRFIDKGMNIKLMVLHQGMEGFWEGFRMSWNGVQLPRSQGSQDNIGKLL